jgi:hypothetical protein
MERHSVRVQFADGNTVETEINGTEAEIRDYYLHPGRQFQFGDSAECPDDNLQCAVKVDFLA